MLFAINFYTTQLCTFWFYERLESIFLFIHVGTMLCYMCILYMSDKNTNLSAVYAQPNISSFDRLMFWQNWILSNKSKNFHIKFLMTKHSLTQNEKVHNKKTHWSFKFFYRGLINETFLRKKILKWKKIKIKWYP